MNTFLAYCFLRGVDTAPASVQDIGSVTIKPNGSTSQWSWSPSRLQNRRLLHKSVEIDVLDKLIADFTQDPLLNLDLIFAYFINQPSITSPESTCKHSPWRGSWSKEEFHPYGEPHFEQKVSWALDLTNCVVPTVTLCRS
jgi:hypothetical protein